MATKKSHIVGSANLTVTIAYEDINGSNLVISDPGTGQYQIKKLRLDTDGKSIVVVHSDTPEA